MSQAVKIALKNTFLGEQGTLAHYADEVERAISLKAMKEIPGAAEQAMRRLPREGAPKHKFLDIESNIEQRNCLGKTSLTLIC